MLWQIVFHLNDNKKSIFWGQVINKEIIILDRKTYSEWNEFLINSPQNCIFANSNYLDSLGAKYKILVYKIGDEIIAGMVLAKNEIGLKSNPMFAKYLGIYFGEIIGNIYNTESKKRKISAMFSDYLVKQKSFNYYFHPDFNNWLSFYWKGFRQEIRYTYRIELTDINKIRNKYYWKLKNEIKNAINQGITIIDNINLERFYEVYNLTYLRQGSKAPMDKNKLISFLDKQQSNGTIKLFAATLPNDTYIAVCGIVFDNKTAYLILNGIDITKLIRGTNAYLIDYSIESFIGAVETFDFEGSMHKEIEAFYRKFGGELTMYQRIYKPSFINFLFSFTKNIYKKIKYGR